MAAAESLLCYRLRSSPLKAGAVEGRTLSGSPLSRNLHEEVHAMRSSAACLVAGGGYAMAEKNADDEDFQTECLWKFHRSRR